MFFGMFHESYFLLSLPWFQKTRTSSMSLLVTPSNPVNVVAPVLKTPTMEIKAVSIVVEKVHVELTALTGTEVVIPHC